MAENSEDQNQSKRSSSDMLLMRASDVVKVLATGALVGLVGTALYYLLEQYVFSVILCGDTAVGGRCGDESSIAAITATILAALGGLAALIVQRVYRPLLVALLATIGLWNVVISLVTFEWWLAGIASALIFALAYATFAWLAQLRNFYLALGIGIVAVIAMRLVITS